MDQANTTQSATRVCTVQTLSSAVARKAVQSSTQVHDHLIVLIAPFSGCHRSTNQQIQPCLCLRNVWGSPSPSLGIRKLLLQQLLHAASRQHKGENCRQQYLILTWIFDKMALAQKAASSRIATRRTTSVVARAGLRRPLVVKAAAQSDKVSSPEGSGYSSQKSVGASESDLLPLTARWASIECHTHS